jgi:hypothetical protein
MRWAADNEEIDLRRLDRRDLEDGMRSTSSPRARSEAAIASPISAVFPYSDSYTTSGLIAAPPSLHPHV